MTNTIRTKRGRTIAIATACLCCMCITGCLSQNHIDAEVSATLDARYALWKAEHRGEEKERRLLSGALSLKDSVQIALANNREIEIAQMERHKAYARVVEAYSAAMPKVDITGTYTRLDQVPSFANVSIGNQDNYSLKGAVTQPLYQGGAVGAGIRASKFYRALTDEQLRGVRQKVTYNVRKAYYDAQLAQELEKASADAVRVAERLLEDTRQGRNVGVASDFDVLRADVELKNLTAQNVQDQNRSKIAVTTLLNLMGISQESNIRITDEFKYIEIQPHIEEAVQIAFQRHPDLIQSELNVRIQKEALRAAKADFLPTLEAFFNESFEQPDPHDSVTNSFNDAWSAGLTAKYTLFQGFQTIARCKQEKLTLEQQQKHLQLTEERILLEIRQALLSLQDADKLVESQKANKETAAEALRLVTLGAEQGTRKQVEVLDAQRALTQANTNDAQALYTHEIARLLLERAIGALDEPSSDTIKPSFSNASGQAETIEGVKK